VLERSQNSWKRLKWREELMRSPNNSGRMMNKMRIAQEKQKILLIF
jgi:hypothetical protein